MKRPYEKPTLTPMAAPEFWEDGEPRLSDLARSASRALLPGYWQALLTWWYRETKARAWEKRFPGLPLPATRAEFDAAMSVQP